ncbi:unnamed protein product [Rotaria socialis]|uniref:Uncharacterized protein n=1 Tax=Rotaria socialis TaxID=392032 RepID=A0A821I134_9BILA|nr:unnamed protein product [Rotaria socialis]CAF4691590.1 unnamed protein product [Rotaria socialis]
MKATIGQEKQQRIQQSSMTTGQLSPVSSSNFSPLMVASFNENLDTQSTGFETDRKSYTSVISSDPPIINASRPKTKIYTHKICQAKYVESEPVEKILSTITIQPIVTLNQHEVKHFNE